MTNLRKLLPGGKREPKVLVVFSNTQVDCDRLIRYLSRSLATSPVAYPIHVYCLEKPYEAQRCAHVVVDPNPGRLYRRAQRELADVWVALSATSWNKRPRGTLMKLIPLTIPPFRGIVGNENGDVFALSLFPMTRHLIHRGKQRYFVTAAAIKHGFELGVIWPLRHVRAWFLRELRDKVFWGTAVALGRMAWFAKRIGPFTRSMFERLPKGAPSPIGVDSAINPNGGITRIEYHDVDWDRARIAKIVEESRIQIRTLLPARFRRKLRGFPAALRGFADFCRHPPDRIPRVAPDHGRGIAVSTSGSARSLAGGRAPRAGRAGGPEKATQNSPYPKRWFSAPHG